MNLQLLLSNLAECAEMLKTREPFRSPREAGETDSFSRYKASVPGIPARLPPGEPALLGTLRGRTWERSTDLVGMHVTGRVQRGARGTAWLHESHVPDLPRTGRVKGNVGAPGWARLVAIGPLVTKGKGGFSWLRPRTGRTGEESSMRRLRSNEGAEEANTLTHGLLLRQCL